MVMMMQKTGREWTICHIVRGSTMEQADDGRMGIHRYGYGCDNGRMGIWIWMWIRYGIRDIDTAWIHICININDKN